MRYQEGQAALRHEVAAAAQVRNLSALPTMDIVLAYSSLYLLADSQPHRFKSDRAFNFQLVRRLRGLTPMNAGSYYDHKTRSTRRVYRDLPPRATEILAQWVKDCFGSCGLQLAELERQPDRDAEERQRLALALAKLQ